MNPAAPGRRPEDGEETALWTRVKNWLLMALVILSVVFLFIMVIYDATSMYCGFVDWLLRQCPQRIRPG